MWRQIQTEGKWPKDSEEEPATSQRTPKSTRGEERGLGQTLPHCSREEPTLLTPRSQTSSLQNCESKFLLFKQTNLWYFVKASSGIENMYLMYKVVASVACIKRSRNERLWINVQTGGYPTVLVLLEWRFQPGSHQHGAFYQRWQLFNDCGYLDTPGTRGTSSHPQADRATSCHHMRAIERGTCSHHQRALERD